MLRRTLPDLKRLLCLTMLPDGGALTPALKTLGYTPYSLRSSYQQGHASTHPVEWSMLLDRKKTMDKGLFAEYDCFVGPPAALLYDVILRDCPSYTKVILVEEPDKARWAAEYDEYLAKVQRAMRHASKNKVTISFNNMLEKMAVRGGPDPAGGDGAAATPTSVSKFSYAAQPRKSTARTSTPSDLERALKAESNAGTLREPEEGSGEANGEEEAVEEPFPMSPRAIALERYEESVKMAIPSSRLLIYRYGDGWEPICEFLERPVPQESFPPYDNGLRVLGFLQERIQWAETIMYVLITVTALAVLAYVWPYLGGVRRFASDMYQDYQLAFGGEGEPTPRRPRAAAETFEDQWRKRGGTVTVELKNSP